MPGGSSDFQVRIKAVMDIGDVVSNVGVIQKTISKLKLPDKIGNNLNKNISELYKEYDKYQKKIAGGIKTQGDYNQVEKSLNRIKSLYGSIGKDLSKVTNGKVDLDSMLKFDGGKSQQILNEINQVIKTINQVSKIDGSALTKPFDELKKLTSAKNIVNEKDGLIARIMGHVNKGETDAAKAELDKLKAYAEKVSPRTITKTDSQGNTKEVPAPGTFNEAKYSKLQSIIQALEAEFAKGTEKAQPFINQLNILEKELAETTAAAKGQVLGDFSSFKKEQKNVENVTNSLKKMHQEEFGFNREAQNIDRQVQSYFGLSQMIRKVGDIARSAFNTVKELDAAMVETAVVTNFDVGDMWNMLPIYTENANQLGSTIKDVYEAATLYYQQGLNQAQSMGLANETLKMARIGGLQAAEATNMMTAALRGFNMEINQTSATRINDVYSELAAITAADTKEIGSAMERTASIANSANMQFETTSAFLAQMIETTREAPENLGTAMKTIIARFQEMKQDPTRLVDSEGVAMDANKIDTALKTIGVDLTNQKGEFRDLDSVFLEISEKWDSLTQGQQRYIATIAAGSRQQSRFIAMMQNHERVMELVEAANNSAGASQKQFEKTLDSMSSKLNRLKNAWAQFTMGLMNNQLIKGGVDVLTKGFSIINKIIDTLGKIPPSPFEGITKSILTLVTTLGMLQLGKKGSQGLIMGGVGWWKGEGKFTKNFQAGFSSGGAAAKDGQAYGKVFSKNVIEACKKENTTLKQGIFAGTKQTWADSKNVMSFQQAFGHITDKSTKLNGTAIAQIQTAFTNSLKNVDSSVIGQQEGQEFVEGLVKGIKNGEISVAQAVKQLEEKTNGQARVNKQPVVFKDEEERKGATGPGYAYKDSKIGKIGTAFDKVGKSAENAGNAVMMFGMFLQHTPLAPFGTAISMAGTALLSFGSTISAIGTAYVANITKMGAAQAGLAVKAKALGLAMWESLGPIALIIAGIMALVGIYKLLDKVIVTDKERLEAASDAAAKADEAFSSAKQATSELNDALSQIAESDKAFDSLVVGTVEFNEQLVKTNEQISDLLSKYPMLMDYITTDENGLMHISDAGVKAVKDYQKQVEARASAMNLIQSADYKLLENEQKAEDLEKKADKFGTSDSDAKRYKEKAKYLREQAEAEVDLSRRNAIRTALNQKELQDVDAISAVYAKLYESKRKAAEQEVYSLSKDDILKQYADYHDYTYDSSTKKMKDIEGNEVDWKDDYKNGVIKDEVIEQTVLLDFEENAADLDNVLSNLDAKFNDTFSKSFKNAADFSYEDTSHFISNLLSSNIDTNTDLLKQVLESPKQLEGIVNDLSEAEIAAILGETESTVSSNVDKYKKDVVDLFTERATEIAQAQTKSFEDLGAMMAQAQYGNLDTASTKKAEDNISQQIKELKTEQANLLSAAGTALKENVGSEAMKTFMNESLEIYKNGSDNVVKQFDSILGEINWESPTSRLEGYNKMIQSSEKEIQKMGTAMRGSADEANLLGESFDEFLGKDWVELSENADNFKNSMGEIDGTGILKAAEESSTLKKMLDSGEVSATALGKALQAVEDGKLSQVNTTVLKLLSSMDGLTNAAYKAHQYIEGFDPGIDFGEGEDFVKENAEKASEYYNNGEWGNEQLQNYIKAAAGADRWSETLRKNKGDLQATTGELMHYVDTFKDGFQPAWDQMISGKNINGKDLSKTVDKAIKDGRIDEKLEKPFKDFKVSWGEDGFMKVDVGEMTTSELETYFQEIYGVSKEYAQLLLQDLKNYDGTVQAALQKNDLNSFVKSEQFQEERVKNVGGKEVPIFTDTEIKAFEEAGGSLEELAEAAGTTADVLESNQFKLKDENGNDRGGKGFVQDFAKVLTGTGRIDSLFKEKSLQDKKGNLDLDKVLAKASAWGLSEQQKQDAAWLSYKRGDQLGKTSLYEGVELKKGMSKSEFEQQQKTITDTKKWGPVGEAIAAGILKGLGKENTEDLLGGKKEKEETPGSAKWLFDNLFSTGGKEKEGSKDSGSDSSDKGSSGKGDTTSGLGLPSTSTTTIGNVSIDTAAIQGQLNQIANAGFKGLVSGIKPESINTPEAQASLNSVYKAALSGKPQELTEGFKKDLSNLGISVEDAIKTGLVIKPEEVAGDVGSKADQAANSAEKATKDSVEKIVDKAGAGGIKGAKVNPKPQPQPQQQQQQKQQKQQPQTQTPQVVKQTVATDDTALDKSLAKVKKLTDAASKPQTIAINAREGKSTKNAFDSIKKIREAAKKKVSINIGAKVKGKEDVNNLSSIVKKVKSHTVKVAAKVSGASNAKTLRTEISKLKNKTITVTTNYKTNGSKGPATGGLISHAGVLYRARGGLASNPMFKRQGTDTIPTMLTPGEYVENRDAVKYFGVDFMRRINHKDLNGALRSFGSAARGRRGRIGPNGNGGLTLTGERGFEVAWLPSEGRSVILGSEGPQMVSLPSDAVVYDHEQSEDILKKNRTIDAGSQAVTNDKNGRKRQVSSSGSSGGKSKSKSKKKGKKRKGSGGTKTKWIDISPNGNIAAYSYNIEKKIEQIKRRQESTQKRLNKLLENAAATMGSIAGTADLNLSQLKSLITYNSKLEKNYQSQLTALAKNGKATIKYEKKLQKVKVSKKTGKVVKKTKETKTESASTSVNLGKYIYWDNATKSYQIDDKAINKAFTNKSLKDAVLAEAKKRIDDLTSKRDAAIQAQEEAQEKIDEMAKSIYENFYSWKNELTKILQITQQITDSEKQTSRLKQAQELEEARVASGMITSANTSQLYKAQMKATTQEIALRKDAIEEQKKVLINAFGTEDESREWEAAVKAFNAAKKDTAAKEALGVRKSEALEQYNIAKNAQKYLRANLNADGTVSIAINQKYLEDQRNAGNISKEMYEGIKQYYDNVIEQNDKLNELYEEQLSNLTELYNTLKDLQESYADRSEELLEATEDAQEQEIDKLEKINSSLTDAFKDLYDEIRKRLDERRKQEDNQQKETDITNKLARLAALRADTSGSNAKEIKQLEKEIAEDQKSYGRDLEDQRLQKLQDQADEAAKQRERQINLLQQQLEYSKTSGGNLELVKQYLANPEAYQTEIKELWRTSKEYYDKTEQRQAVLDNEWNSFWDDIRSEGGLGEKIALTQEAINNSNESLDDIKGATQQLVDLLVNNSGRFLDLTNVNAAKDAKLAGYDLRSIINDMDLQRASLATKKNQVKNAGFTAKNFKDQQFSVQTAADYGFTKSQLRNAGYTYKQIQGVKQNNKANGLGVTEFDLYEDTLNSKKSITTKEFKEAWTKAQKAKIKPGTFLKRLANTSLTWKQVLTAAKGAVWNKYRLAASFNDAYFQAGYNAVYGKNSYKTNSTYAKRYPKKYPAYAFAQGGLADYTGPAWLDGTKSKPELVLNSADTKNFLALKDVLSRAIHNTNSISNNNNDVTYDIDINVDHISSDYDVDRLTERIKKNIIKDAGYRNVTQVRNFV